MTVAFWCILAAIFMPYACFGLTRNLARRAGTLRDNRNPRDFVAHLQGPAKRAWAAHLNAFESLPGFAAAVFVATLAHAPQGRIDALAVTWVIARVLYIAFYVGDRSTLRSTVQFVSLACVLGLFVVAA
jgi:uncharacterized MAPEG superfamily protein